MNYCLAVYNRDMTEKICRVYITDALRVISESTAAIGRGKYMQKRFADIIDPKPEETRTPEEVMEYMKNKLRGGEKD